MAIRPGEEFGAEPERKGVDLHATPATDEEMPELVEEDDDAEHEDERHEIAGERPQIR